MCVCVCVCLSALPCIPYIAGNIRGVRNLWFLWLGREPRNVYSRNVVTHMALYTACGMNLENLQRNRDDILSNSVYPY